MCGFGWDLGKEFLPARVGREVLPNSAILGFCERKNIFLLMINIHLHPVCLRASLPRVPAGTTCLIALLSDKELTVANVGDSRGVLCDKDGNAIPLSHDHKPYQLKERKRIKRAGELSGGSSFVWR